MKGKIAKSFLAVTACVCTIMALAVSASACLFTLYQPEEPKCLRK
jgi:hypothetical protein